ncbi:MAG TPA: S41 family peptidase [Chondromyces sp.]|nr:S41 family peptidase [Chondromyces sp.]
MKRKWVAVMVTCSFLAGSGGMYAGLKVTEEKDAEGRGEQPNIQQEMYKLPDELHKVQTAYDLISAKYVEKVDREKLVEGAIEGMLSSLDDPYSVYMDAETVNQFNDTLDSSFEGIGAEITVIDGKLIIVAPFKNSPAEDAGLKPNDQIISIDGKKVSGLNLYDATKKIRGEKGSTVKLGIMREGVSKPIELKVKRDEIPLETVNAKIKQENSQSIGYIEITSFSERTGRDFKAKLASLEEKDIKGLIIDVRGNPGGLLTSVEEILKELVTANKPYLQIEERTGKKVPYFTERKQSKPYPITVLIDKGSASASEILAGSLKEAEGYTVIGEKSFGKGTVQQAVPLGDGSNIKLTTFKWLTPNGNWIHRKGIEPNIEIRQPDYFHVHPLQIEKTLKLEDNNDQVKNAQEMLEGLGYGPGRTDGYFNKQTEKAVRAFQMQNSLKATGQIDTKTAEVLEGRLIESIQDDRNDLQLQTALKYIGEKVK